MKKFLLLFAAVLTFSLMAKADGDVFTESFENGYPSNWTMIDADGDGNNWDITHYVPAHTGDNSMYSYSYDNAIGALTPDNYMVTQLVELVPGSTLTIWASVQDISYPEEHFGIGVSSDAENFTMVAEWTLTAKTPGEWYQYTAYVGDFAGNMYLGIRHFNSTDQFMLKIDDVELLIGEIPTPCYAPSNLAGECIYNEETMSGGSLISWDAPEVLPLHYNLYCEATKDVIEVEAEATSYFDEKEIGDYLYRLTAVYEDCESEYALTPTGEDFVIVSVNSVAELISEEIMTIQTIYNLNGQIVNADDINYLKDGVYIVEGLTKEGIRIVKKIVVKR